MTIKLTILLILLLSLSCIAVMIYKFIRQPSVHVSKIEYIKLITSGILAFISDTIGVGSFAVNIALAKIMGTFRDVELPAVCNGAQVIPGTLQSLFFMQLVNVPFTMLVTLVSGACIGGAIGGHIVARLSKQAIRLTMIVCFMIIIGLLICEKLNLMSVGGTLTELHNWPLLFGFIGMVICGALTSAGIGLFAMVQGLLFLLNVSPIVAFPIMTTAGAMQQPVTTLVFLQQNKIPLKKTLILSIAGCVGVLIALPIVSHLTTAYLHSLLLLVLCYNLFTMSRAFLNAKQTKLSTPSNFVEKIIE